MLNISASFAMKRYPPPMYHRRKLDRIFMVARSLDAVIGSAANIAMPEPVEVVPADLHSASPFFFVLSSAFPISRHTSSFTAMRL